MQVVLNIKESFRTTGSGHNREVVALYRWPLVQAPCTLNRVWPSLYYYSTMSLISLMLGSYMYTCTNFVLVWLAGAFCCAELFLGH